MLWPQWVNLHTIYIPSDDEDDDDEDDDDDDDDELLSRRAISPYILYNLSEITIC